MLSASLLNWLSFLFFLLPENELQVPISVWCLSYADWFPNLYCVCVHFGGPMQKQVFVFIQENVILEQMSWFKSY
jgi:hypothetical protein